MYKIPRKWMNNENRKDSKLRIWKALRFAAVRAVVPM